MLARLGQNLCLNAGQDLGGSCFATVDAEDPLKSWWHSRSLPLLP